MKTLVLLATIATMFILGVSSCVTRKPVYRQVSDNNKDYTVSYLFEHDGCKVYRFIDNGEYVYFTNCTGSVSSVKSDSVKTRIQNIVTRR